MRHFFLFKAGTSWVYLCIDRSSASHLHSIARFAKWLYLILIFVFFAFCLAILFSDPCHFAAAHLTIYFFATGAIAGLVFKGMTIGKRFTGERKQKMKKQIEKAVILFYGPRHEEVRITYYHLNTHV